MSRKLLLFFLTALSSLIVFSQETDSKSVTYFEKFIINGVKPPDTIVQTKYESDYRVIVWNDPLIKDYKYSNEAFYKQGYEFVKKNEGDSQQRSKIYRNCSKGIIVEVTEWYNVKLSVSLKWFALPVRKGVGYLMYCYVEKQTDEEIKNSTYNSFKANAVNKFKNTSVDYSDRKNKPVLIDGNAFLKAFYYEIIQKSNEFANKCIEIVLNKDGTKEFKTNWSVDIDTKSTNYQSFQTFIKNELPKLGFSNPKEYVWGDSISTTTRIDANVIYTIKYLGVIKVSLDSKNLSITIKSKDVPAEIKTEELLQSLKDKKSGTYKLSYFNVTIALDNCYDGGNFFAKTTFVGNKVYEIGDEYLIH
ncbi:MAG TPA: hypothetical protein VFC67_05195 [Prolixibacteraceae bacterium]|nr:hypothetical protein [Prolixibacteraceae bacterium]